jgi:hypothetical protein
MIYWVWLKCLKKSKINRKNSIFLKNLVAPNNRVPKYVEQKLTELKRQTDNTQIFIGDVSDRLPIEDWTSRQKINKEIEDLSNTINQQGLTDLGRALYPIIDE